MIVEGLTKKHGGGSIELLLHRKGRARGRRVHDSGGVVVVVVHDDGRGRRCRRCRYDLFHVFVFAPLADGVEPHSVRPRQKEQIRDPVPARRGVSGLGPRVHLDLCGNQPVS